MGQLAITWQQEVTSVSVTQDGGELGVTIQQTVGSLLIVALTLTYVMVMGGVFGMKEFVFISPDVSVILVGICSITVCVPRD